MDEQPEVETIRLNPAGIDLSSIQSGPPEDSMDTTMGQPVSSYLDKGDPTERRSKIIHIRRYQATFQKYLQDVQLPDPETLSLQELEHLLSEVKLTVSCRSTSRFVDSSFFHLLKISENVVSNLTPLRLQGLSDLMSQDEETKDLLAEVSLENLSILYADPRLRLGIRTAQSALQIHSLNKQKETMTRFLQNPVPQTLKEKYSQL